MTTSLPIRFVAIERICLLGVLLLIAVWFISTGLSLPPGEVRAPNQDEFEQAGLHFNYFRHYFLPLLVRVALISAGFYQLNFRIMPQLIDGIQQSRNSLLLILIIFGTFVVNLITELYMRQYLFFSANAFASHARVWREAFLLSLGLMLAFVAYTCLKYTGVYLLKHTIRSLRTKKILGRELTIALSIWALVGVLLGFSRAEELFMLWLLAAPSAYAFYLFAARWAIPKAMQVRRKKVYYFLVSSVFCLLLFFAGALLFALIFDDEDAAAGAAASSAFVQLLIAAPASWVIYKRQMKGRDELVALKKELGASTANLDFLRSQINPHFLFNALNTIYGTAIQEGAERTGEGIEKLGSMMRFMLLENVQDKIALVRDIEYLNNYISLQTLRTQTSPQIRIQIDIQDSVSPLLQIAPMLLIPFVENAFKHGISLREESVIRVSLEVRDGKLYFDVYNSKHQRPQHDPEKYNNGIGLANVRQRLQLLYPGKHELVIRETSRDFFVHLTLTLDPKATA